MFIAGSIMTQKRESPISIAGRDAIESFDQLCTEVRTADDRCGMYRVSARCLGGDLKFTEETDGYQVRISASGIGQPPVHSGVILTSDRFSWADLLLKIEWAILFRLLLGKAGLDSDYALRRNLIRGGCVIFGPDGWLLRQLSDDAFRGINGLLERHKGIGVMARATLYLQDQSCAFWVTGLRPNEVVQTIASTIDTFARMNLWTLAREKDA